MFSFFNSSPLKKLKKKRSKLLKQGVEVQRSGDLRAYAEIMKEVDELDQKIELNEQ